MGGYMTQLVSSRAKVYVETSVISYLTAWPSRDIVIAGHQQTTREWWQEQRQGFQLVASQLVIQEASAGDRVAAQERLEVLKGIELLELREDALKLAQVLTEIGPLPKKAAEDALHIAIAVTNGVEYLLTWNYKHIANAVMRSSVERMCRAAGYEPTIICTLKSYWSRAMKEDPIVEEVRHYREQHAAQFNYDLRTIYQDLKEQECRSEKVFTSYSVKQVEIPSQTAVFIQD
jgi:predicted nucleic acid-binding protein